MSAISFRLPLSKEKLHALVGKVGFNFWPFRKSEREPRLVGELTGPRSRNSRVQPKPSRH